MGSVIDLDCAQVIRALLPRLVLVVIAAPIVALALVYALPTFQIDAATPAAVASAMTFAAIAMAPSTTNAIVRACVYVVVAGGVALAAYVH